MDLEEMFLAKEAVNRVALICALLAEPNDDNLSPAIEATADLQQLLPRIVEAHNASDAAIAASGTWERKKMGELS
jgi:hypothetical protein